MRLALQRLDDERRFDLIEFADWGGLGFRSVQARRAGLAFASARLVVTLHGPTQWMREANRQWIKDEDELQLDFCERYAFENADVQASPSRYLLEYVRQAGWAVRPDALVAPYPVPDAPGPPPGLGDGPPEVVFFGRLETRKGLELFVEVARGLPPEVRLTFLGRPSVVGGEPAIGYIRDRLRGRRYQLLTDRGREEALRYLAEGGRLAIMPALADNYPYAVVECAAHGIPFLASSAGGTPEIVPDEGLHRHLFFRPVADDLGRRLAEYLGAGATERAAWRDRARDALGGACNAEFVARYEGIARAPASPPAPAEGDIPLVSVVVPYHNLPDYLPATLDALAAQTWPRLDVIVIDDGSTDPAAVRAFAEQEQRFPGFRFLRQDNAGIGATRNRGLREAAGEYVVCVDADNVARPEMVERLVTALRRRPEYTALSCYFLAFRDDEGLARGDYLHAYRPTGGPHVVGTFRNVYGDANSIYRTADFRAAGGFETDRDTSFEDWEAFVKLVRAGRRVDVVPEHLFYYRFRDEGFSRATDQYRNRQRVLRQYLASDRLPLAERVALWAAVTGFQHGLEHLRHCLGARRYRLADRAHALLRRLPLGHRLVCSLYEKGSRLWRALRRPRPEAPAPRRTEASCR